MEQKDVNELMQKSPERLFDGERVGMSTHSCNKPDYHHRVTQLESRVRELEAELAKCQQVATPIGFGEILQSALDERDNLRSRHAALVEKYNELLDV